MNTTVYLFGSETTGSDSRYYQYPNDYSSDIFKRFENQLQDDTLLAVHRNNNLVYHVYIKRVNNGYIGMCASFNGVWVNDSNALIKAFSETFVDVAAQGVFVNVSDEGKLLSKASQLITRIQAAKEVCDQLSFRLAGLEPLCKNLPPLNVAVEATIFKRLPNQASDQEWTQAMNSYRSMYANYSKSGTGGQFYLLLEKLEALSSECGNLKNQNKDLETKCNQIEKQKKQYKAVILLVSLLFIGGIITAFIISEKNGNISYLEEEISSLNSKVDRLNNEIQEKTENLESMTADRNRLEGVVQQKSKEINQLEDKIESIGNHYPMVINKIEMGNSYSDGTMETSYGSTIYSSYTMYLKPKIYYTGISTGSHTLKVKLFTPDGSISKGDSSPSGFSYSGSYYVYSGDDTMELSGWGSSTKGHWKSGSYRIEIWYENVCLETKTFTIY